MRLIDKDAVLNLLKEEMDVIEDSLDNIAVTITRKKQNEYAKAILTDILEEVTLMEESDKSDPEPAFWIEGRKGKDWVECKCSKCNQSTSTPKDIRMPYCATCGSKMTVNAGGGAH